MILVRFIISMFLLLGCASEAQHAITPQTPKTERARDTTALNEVFTNGGYYVWPKVKKK